jgi:hypothetical protein
VGGASILSFKEAGHCPAFFMSAGVHAQMAKPPAAVAGELAGPPVPSTQIALLPADSAAAEKAIAISRHDSGAPFFGTSGANRFDDNKKQKARRSTPWLVPWRRNARDFSQ